MNDLIIKNVPFCQAELLAVQDRKTGKIYAGINCILRELGFDDRQIEYRRNKWNDDKVISKGVQKFSYPSENRGNQEAYCIDIKKLPIALAKIDITPKMENEMPKLSKKLEKYQDECADILANAFVDGETSDIPKDYPSALRLAADEYEKRLLAEQKNSILQKENDLLTQKTLEWADRAIINALVRAYGYNIGGDYSIAWIEFKKELLYRYGINLNARKTAHLNNGGSKSKKTLDFLNDDELPQAINTVVAMCRNNNVDISEIIEKKAG